MPLPEKLVTPEGISLQTYSWKPGKPKAAVIVVHGYAEYALRHTQLALRLRREGYWVIAYDQRGYGKSDGKRTWIASFESYLNDLRTVINHINTIQVPLFLFGHSMGGLVVLRFAQTNNLKTMHPAVKGVIFSSPAIKTNASPLLQKISGLIGALFPSMPTVPLDETSLSRDPNVLDDVKNDTEYYHGKLLARTGAEMIHAMNMARKSLRQITDPFLVFHGTGDRLTDPQGSQMLYDQAISDDKILNLYEGLYHETFNEPEKEKVFSDIIGWLNHRT